MSFAQGLPIISIPKQLFIPLMWDDMVYDRSQAGKAFYFALNTERMAS